MFNIYDYDILEKCYENTEGIVYKARHKQPGKDVLLKKLNSQNITQGNGILREVKCFKTASFKPWLPFTFFDNESNPVYALKNLPSGESVDALVQQSTWGTHQKNNLALAILSAIQDLHNVGLMCLDLQPCNIWTNENATQIYFIDGSTVRKIKSTFATKNTISLLSPYYQSPELTGRIAAVPDQRSDFYLFGLFLYELYCGRKPFSGKDAANVIYQQISQIPLEPAVINDEVGLGLSNVIMKLLSKNPDKRYSSFRGIRKDLEMAFTLMDDPYAEGDFELAKYDMPETFTLAGELVAKDEALLQLTRCIQLSQRSRNSQLIEIKGERGTGKSTLVNSFEKYLLNHDVLFVKGSFANDNQVPYSGLREACSQLIKILLSMPEDQLVPIRETVIKKGGTALSVLSDFLPEFTNFIQIDSTQKFTEPSSTNESLVYVISIFFSAVAVSQKGLVLIWEDFQLANRVSLKLIDNLYHQDSFSNIIGVAVFQTGLPQDEYAIHLQNIATLGEAKFFSLTVPLLSVEDTNYWLVQSNFDSNIAYTLAQKLNAESGGIASRIVELVSQVYNDNSLIKNEEGKWTIEPNLIESIELKKDTDEERANKAKQFSKEETTLIQFAVSLIQPFNRSALFEVSNLETNAFNTALQNLVHSKYIQAASQLTLADDASLECADPHFTKFIKAAISNEEANAINFAIASMLSKKPNGEIIRLYQLLSFVVKLPPQLAATFSTQLREGAMAASREAAFQTALTYWLKLIDCYANDYWNKHPEAAFDLFYKGAETAIWALDDAIYNRLLTALRNIEQTLYHATSVCFLEMQYANKHGNYNEVIAAGRRALANMNIRISTEPTLLKIITSLAQLNMKVGRKGIDELGKIQSASKPEDVLMLQVIETMISAIFLAKPKMLPEAMSIQIRKALQVGFSDSIGIAFMSYAFILTSFNPDYKKARGMADISFFLHKKFNNPYPLVAAKFIYGVFVQHWFYPIGESKQLLEETYLSGRQAGNINIAFYALVLSEIHNLFAGTSLTEVLERSIQFNGFATNQREQLSKEYFYLLISFCEELREPVFREKAFAGWHNEIEEIVERQNAANNYSSILLIELFRNTIQLLNEDYKGSEAYLTLLNDAQKIIGKASYQLSFGHLVGGLKITRQSNAVTKQQEVLLKRALQYLQTCYKQMPANHAAKYYCLLASYKRKQGKYTDALDCINRAIDSAAENHLTIEEAISWEEKSLIQTGMNQLNGAHESLKCAYLVYEKWGALAKLAKLRQQQSIMFIDEGHVNPFDKGNRVLYHSDPDIANLVKASNSISGEIKLEKLLEKMFTILAETAGAQHIFLLVYEEAKLIEYTYVYDPATSKITTNKTAEQDLPLSIINYVRRSRQVILISDISNEPLYKKDPYFQSKGKASVLCVPLIKNGELLGMVYMENEITKGAFTEERLGLIKMLSSQMAISLENAMLYENMEAKIKFRTEQLSIEKERTESLLLNILPRSIAEELKEKGTTTARLHKGVTVLFSDIVSFTKWSTMLDPQTLVSDIDHYFRKFDDIVTAHNLEKIKTVGDAYIAVGGLSQSHNTNTPCTVIDAAIEMQQFVQSEYEKKIAGGQDGFQMRIGIHIGAVVAGVVGSKKFAFDIWGDTVNIAARLQENGEPGKINISGDLFSLIGAKFHCIPRGKIKIKNHGELDMFFIDSPQ